MANTINDVMNVIASPDYGIKNIAGTNQEILAILQGTHNSKNNIYNIVDDVRNLLQELVDVETKKKTVQISGNNSTKINHRHIQDILDETKGIRKAIDNLSKSIGKSWKTMPAVAKLSNKASEKVANAMVKSMNKQNVGSGLSSFIDTFSKLKNISLKDIFFGKIKLNRITEIFNKSKENLKNIKEKDLESIIKLIKFAPEMVKSLSSVGFGVNKIIRKNIIEKLSDILVGKNSILSLSTLLNKNKKLFENANKASKDIMSLASSISKTILKLFIASLFVKSAEKGVKNIDTTLDKLIDLSKKLTKNKKDIEKGSKVAKDLTILSGNLLITSIFLTISAVTGGPAILGAKFLSIMIEKITPAVKELNNNSKNIKKASKAALSLTTFTGLMAVSSLFLATIAVTGVPAILGSILIVGIIKITSSAFKLLSKAKKNILVGSIAMMIMSTSLLLFGIALKKIIDATKDVNFKQIGIIATMTVLLGGVVAALGIPAVVPFILLGSISIAAMSLALIPFAKSLDMISKSTKGLKMKDILIISGSMMFLGLSVAGIGYISAPIIVGSIAIAAMGLSLMPFVKTIKVISKSTKGLKMKDILLVTGSMITLGLGIAGMSILSIPITIGSMVVRIMTNVIYKFANTLKKINDLGTIPTKIVHQTLNALGAIGKFFMSNLLKRKSIKNAERYKDVLKPFGKTLQQLSKLKELGVIPMKLVHQTLNALGTIANFYINNKIKKKAIKQAKRYKKILRPFGKTLQYLLKLKELGVIPMKLVHQTLNALGTIANYYINNKIKKKAIKRAERYRDILKPFGKTIKHLSKLKELGVIPMKLIHQTLNTMSTIANFYINNKIKKKAIKQAKRYKKILRPFGKTIKHLSKLKELGVIPMKLIHQTLNTMSLIANYYIDNPIDKNAIKQAKKYKKLLKPFGNSIQHLSKLKELGVIPINAINSSIIAMKNIALFYNTVELDNTELDINNIKSAIDKFADIAAHIHEKITKKITTNELANVLIAIKSMKTITEFLKSNSLKRKQRNRAIKSIKLLKDMTSIMSTISNINPTNLSSVGESMLNTLSNVNTVDINKVKSVTNMFNAFNKINKSENIINKFTESVKEFTESCKNLMNAMSDNTNAINNIDGIGINGENTNKIKETNIIEKSSNGNMYQTGEIRIINVDEIAKTIAEKINGALSLDVPDTQVQLFINGIGGNEWTITRY